MINAELQTRIGLPDHLKRFDRNKNDADLLVQRLRQCGLTYYADRIDSCCETLKLREYKNGHKGLSKQDLRFCHCRGCPVCENAIAIRLAGRMGCGLRVISQRETGKFWKLVSLPGTTVTDPSEIPAIRDSMHVAFSKLIRRKFFLNVHGGISFFSVSYLAGTFIPSIEYLFFSGWRCASTITRTTLTHHWGELFQQCDRAQFKVKQFDDNSSIINQAFGLGRINLSLIPDEHLKPFMLAMHRAKSFAMHGQCRELMKDRPSSKFYFPSELAAIRAARQHFFAYAPNPDTPTISNQFLKFNDFPEWNEQG